MENYHFFIAQLLVKINSFSSDYSVSFDSRHNCIKVYTIGDHDFLSTFLLNVVASFCKDNCFLYIVMVSDSKPIVVIYR